MRHACRALAYHGISQSDWHEENLLVEASPGDRPTISVVMVDFGLVNLRQKFIDATGSEALLPFPKWNDGGAKRLLMGYKFKMNGLLFEKVWFELDDYEF